MRMMILATTIAVATIVGGAQAQNAAGDEMQRSLASMACIRPGADGKPSRKLSSEDVCPMYAFWREDCARAGRLGETLARAHCGPAAMGMRDDDILGFMTFSH